MAMLTSTRAANQESRERIRSAWPSFHVGKPMTDKRIAFYQKKGYYSNGLKLPVVQKPRGKRKDVNEGIFD